MDQQNSATEVKNISQVVINSLKNTYSKLIAIEDVCTYFENSFVSKQYEKINGLELIHAILTLTGNPNKWESYVNIDGHREDKKFRFNMVHPGVSVHIIAPVRVKNEYDDLRIELAYENKDFGKFLYTDADGEPVYDSDKTEYYEIMNLPIKSVLDIVRNIVKM